MTSYFKKYRYHILFMLVFALLYSLLVIRAQFIKGEILSIAIGQEEGSVYFSVFIFCLLLVLSFASGQLYAIIRARLVANIARDLKNQIFASVLNRTRMQIKDLNHAAVIARYTTDLQKVETDLLFMGSRLFEFSVIILTTGITLLLINYKIALLTFVVFLIPMWITNAMKEGISKAESDYVTTNETHLSKLKKNLEGLEAIKNYSIEKEIRRLYAGSLKELTDKDLRRSFKRSLANGMSFFSTMISQAAILIYSSFLLYRGELTPGIFVTIFSLVLVLRPPFYWISQLYESVVASRPALNAIFRLIAGQEENEEKEYPKISLATSTVSDQKKEKVQEKVKSDAEKSLQEQAANAPCEGCVEVKNLHFSYDGKRDVIKGFRLSVKPGEKVLITGQSGSGKTTLLGLLTGMLEPDEGTITIGNYSYFKQDAFLFSGSVRDNLTLFNPDIPEAEIERVADICGISELLHQKDSISEGGANLSGGEKKRISLARTFLHNQKILILDEPLANIDPQNIERIENAIVEDREHTILIISHLCSEKLQVSMDQIVGISENTESEPL